MSLPLEEFFAYNRDGKYRSCIDSKLNTFLNKHVNLNILEYDKNRNLSLNFIIRFPRNQNNFN